LIPITHIGILGLAAAAYGGHVLLTDLPVIVEAALIPNITRNENTKEKCNLWPGASSVGTNGGTCATIGLDWFKPIESQVPVQSQSSVNFFDCDIILASDTVWLADLLDPFVNTVNGILQASRNAVCYLAYKDRSTSSVFVNLSTLVSAFSGRGLQIQKILSVSDKSAQQPQGQQHQQVSEIIIFKITK